MVYYANEVGTESTFDEYGNETGEKVVYGAPIPLRVNVSSARNTDTVAVFGLDVNYDKAIIFNGRNQFPYGNEIKETTVFWIDSQPGSVPFDYVVKRVSVGLNSTAVALQKVDVRHG